MEVTPPSEPKPAARFVRKSSKEAVEANRQELNSEGAATEFGRAFSEGAEQLKPKSSKEAVEANRQEPISEVPPQKSASLQKQDLKKEAWPQKLPPLDVKAKKKPAIVLNKKYVEAKQQELLHLLARDDVSWNILESRFDNCKHVLNPNTTDSEVPPQKSASLQKQDLKKEAWPQKLPPLDAKAKKKPVIVLNKKYLEAKQQELLHLLARDDVSWNILENRFDNCKHVLNPNTTDSEAKIATLHRAAFDGAAGCVKWCIQARADVCASTSAGRAPLHYACEGNSASCVELLIRLEADPNQSTLGGATPLHIACTNNCSEAAKALLYTCLDVDVGVGLELEDTRRQTPEMLAKKNPALLEMISKYLVDAENKRKQRIAIGAALAFFANLSEGQLCAVFAAWAKEAQEAKKRISVRPESGGEADEHPSALAEDDEHQDLPAADKASEDTRPEKPSERKKFVPPYALALGLG